MSTKEASELETRIRTERSLSKSSGTNLPNEALRATVQRDVASHSLAFSTGGSAEDPVVAEKRSTEDAARLMRQAVVRPPDAVFHWVDSKPTGAEGWVVLDRIINRCAGGGIFMHANATEQEVADIARNMSRKFTVTDPQIGGAKGGIRFDHHDARAKEVLRRFIVENAQLLKNVWVTAGDLNTSDTYIETVVQNDIGLPTMQSVLGKQFARATGQPDRSARLASIIRHPANPYFPLIEATVGCGVAESIRTALLLVRSELLGKARVMIQGFGAVGSSLAWFLHERKIAVVVGVCDKDGYIIDKNGIDVEKLLVERQKRVVELQQAKANPKLIDEAAKNFYCNLSEERKSLAIPRNHGWDTNGNIAFLQEFLEAQEAEVFSPCALRYQITLSVLKTMNDALWKNNTENRFLVCGANNPYGTVNADGKMQEDRSGKVEDETRRMNICVVPDWVANSGTAQLFHRGISVDFNLKDPFVAQRVLDSCTLPIREFIEQSFALVNGMKEFLPYGCEQFAQERLVNPRVLAWERSLHNNPADSRYCLPPLARNELKVDERLGRCLATSSSASSEVIESLKGLLNESRNPVVYDGIEPSGFMHIALGLLKARHINLMTSAGFTYIILIADWFPFMNKKLDGSLESFKVIGQYIFEVLKAAGTDLTRVQFLYGDDEMRKYADEYWSLVLDVSARLQLKDFGGSVDKDTHVSRLMFPAMQLSDTFFLGADVVHLGEDQAELTKLVGLYADVKGLRKPIALNHSVIPGLDGEHKMTKRLPESAIYMHDTSEDVEAKCARAKIESIIAYFDLLILPNGVVSIDGKEYATTTELKSVGEEALKKACAARLNDMLEPVRVHFATDPTAKELFHKVTAIVEEVKERTGKTN